MVYNSFYIYLPVFYMTVYLVAIAGCFAVRTKTSFLTIIVLSAMAYAGWDQDLWRDAQNMAIFELFVLSAMFFVFEGKFGTRLIFLTFLMIMANVLCLQFDVWESVRQSLISLLFFSQCVITLKASYNTHKIRGYRKKTDDMHFWARANGIISNDKMVH